MARTLTVVAGTDGALKQALNESGWLTETVLAAGQLRQGKAPSTVAMITGLALVEVLRPRRSKSLPRHFVMALTEDRAVAFKATGGSPEERTDYEIRVQQGEEGSWARPEVGISDLAEGRESKDGMLNLAGERIPVTRPNLSGDPNTDELIELLGG